MRILLISLLAGILFAVGGAVAGLAIGALLIELNCLADPGGITVIFFLVVGLAFVGGLYGFVYAKYRLQRRPPSQIRKVRHILVLVCLAAGGGSLLLNAAFLMAFMNIHGGNNPYTNLLIVKLLGVGLLLGGAFYGILAHDLKTGTL
jgi:MFS family permease